MTEKKLSNGMKLVFAPGCFDSFDGTQEELDALVKEIEEGFNDGSFFEASVPVDLSEIDDMDEEEKEALTKMLEYMNDPGAHKKLN